MWTLLFFNIDNDFFELYLYSSHPWCEQAFRLPNFVTSRCALLRKRTIAGWAQSQKTSSCMCFRSTRSLQPMNSEVRRTSVSKCRQEPSRCSLTSVDRLENFQNLLNLAGSVGWRPKRLHRRRKTGNCNLQKPQRRRLRWRCTTWSHPTLRKAIKVSGEILVCLYMHKPAQEQF